MTDMKKTFFLDLDHSGVRLRYGSGNEFPVLGEVSLDDPHFETRLEDLRREAEALSDGPLETVLTIPDTEILFTSVDLPDGTADEAARKARIEAELEGMTPYALGDLVYDWKEMSASKVAVAAAARETLDQAEDFAVSHGFNPRSFSGEPRKGLFTTRPDFGETTFAHNAAGAEAPAPQEPVTRIADLVDDETEDGAGDEAPGLAPLPDPAQQTLEVPEPVATEAPAPEDAMPEAKAAAPDVPAAQTAPAPQTRSPATDAPAKEVRQDEEAGAVLAGAAPAFASRRAPATEREAEPSKLGSIASRVAVLPDGGTAPRQDAPSAPVTQAKPAVGTAGAKRPPGPGPRSSPVPSIRKVAPPAAAPAASLSRRAAADPGAADPAAPAPASGAPQSEVDQMTVFGARKSQTRRGLAILPMVIGLLVALAVAIGIWGAFFLLTPADEVLLSPAGEDRSVALAAGPVDSAVVEDPVTAAVPDAAPDAAPQVDAAAPTDVAATAGAFEGQTLAPGSDDPLRRPDGADEESRYAATGIDATAPQRPEAPSPDRVEEVYTPAAETPLRAQDRVASLAAIEIDPATPPVLVPPPPAGANVDLDTEGRVVPTADGARSLRGVLVTAGLPPVRPPEAPSRPDAPQDAASDADLVVPVNRGTPALRPRERPEESAAAETLTAEAEAEPTIAARIARLSPRPRPDTGDAAATLVPEEGAENVGIAPQGRPDDLAIAVALDAANRARESETADNAGRSGSAAASAAAAALAGLVPGTASPAAVARSVAPAARPQDAAPVEVAQASAIATPSGPTSGSVASRATIANAIKLGQVNLMGVYGSPSNRRALVRLPSGRFVKVKVGDRIDGGRVRMIGDGQLDYVKGGRQIVLRMPNG